MMSKEVMQQALEALKRMQRYGNTFGYRSHEQNPYEQVCEAITSLETELAKPDFWEGYVPEPVKPAQHEPDWLDKEQTETDWDHVWLLIKAANYASSKGFISGTTNWGSAVSRYMRNESPQPAQRTWVGLTDEQILAANYPDGEENGPTISAPDFELDCFAKQVEAKLKEKNT